MDRADGFDPSDRNADDGVSEQLSSSDLLLDRGAADPLDEGYSPPDRPSRVRVPTVSEEIRGSSTAELLAAEVPDVGIGHGSAPDHERWARSDRVRSGRLVSPDDSEYLDTVDDITAAGVGIDGAGASAEEAAMHVIEDSEDGNDEDDASDEADQDRDDDRYGGTDTG